MVSDYITCSKLHSVTESLSSTDINIYLEYLEVRRYSKRTIQSYLSCILHCFYWRMALNKANWLDVD